MLERYMPRRFLEKNNDEEEEEPNIDFRDEIKGREAKKYSEDNKSDNKQLMTTTFPDLTPKRTAKW